MAAALRESDDKKDNPSIIKAAQDYIARIARSMPGMKVLLVDEETTSIVSMVYSQSAILQEEVYLIERIDVSTREPMPHLNAVCFLRPEQDSVDALVAELRRPKYGKYDIYFSNMLSKGNLQRIAEADEHEVVNEVQEFFADFLAVTHHLFTFNVLGCMGDRAVSWRRPALERVHGGLLALMLALRQRPAVRYQAASEQCQQLATDLHRAMVSDGDLFQGRLETSSLLLIVDRRDDPVTPLLNQWTYQAMVHELLGLRNNRVDLSRAPGIHKDLREVVLSAQDDFYTKNMYKNFGEIGGEIRKLVDEFQAHTKSHQKLDTIADMKAFVEQYPEFKAKSSAVSKHVSVVGELSRIVDAQNLLDVSELEQEMAAGQPASDLLQRVRAIFDHPKLSEMDLARLVLLAMLRFDLPATEAVEILSRRGVSDELRQLVPLLQRYAGNGAPCRVSDLFGTRGAGGLLRRITGQLKDVENIYTQHTPLLAQTLDSIAKGKLKEQVFPWVDAPLRDRPGLVFVFFVGGVTYEESRTVALFNEQNQGSMRVLLGGTSILNFKLFAQELLSSPALRPR